MSPARAAGRSLLYFIAINSGVQVPVNLSPMKDVQNYEVSLVILVSLVTGVLFASVIGIVEGWRLRLQNHQLRPSPCRRSQCNEY